MASSLYSLIFSAILAVFVEAQQFPIDCDVNAAQRPSENCGNEVVRFGLKDTEIQEILNAFKLNNYGQMTWSTELAIQAQAWMNQCSDQQNPCFRSPSGQLASNSQSSNDAPVNFTRIIDSSLNPFKNVDNRPATFPHAFPFPNSHSFPAYPNYPNIPNFDGVPRYPPNIPGFPNFQNHPEFPNFQNLPGVPNFQHSPGFPNSQNLPGVPNFQHSSGFPNSQNLPYHNNNNNNNNNIVPFQRYRRAVGDYTNMVGCGFIEYKANGGLNQHFLCYYGAVGNRNLQPGY